MPDRSHLFRFTTGRECRKDCRSTVTGVELGCGPPAGEGGQVQARRSEGGPVHLRRLLLEPDLWSFDHCLTTV